MGIRDGRVAVALHLVSLSKLIQLRAIQISAQKHNIECWRAHKFVRLWIRWLSIVIKGASNSDQFTSNSNNVGFRCPDIQPSFLSYVVCLVAHYSRTLSRIPAIQSNNAGGASAITLMRRRGCNPTSQRTPVISRPSAATGAYRTLSWTLWTHSRFGRRMTGAECPALCQLSVAGGAAGASAVRRAHKTRPISAERRP